MPGAQALVQQGRAAEAAGQLDQAARLYAGALQEDPSHVAARFQLAQLAFKSGAYEAALRDLEIAEQLRPREAAIWGLQARCYMKIADRARSEAFLDRAEAALVDRTVLAKMRAALLGTPKAGPDMGSAPTDQVMRAVRMLQSGNAVGAAELAGHLRAAHPEVAVVAGVYGTALAASGHASEAEPHLQAAVDLAPEDAEARANLGRFLVERGRIAEALPQLEEAHKLAPRFAKVLTHLGVAHARLGQAPEGIAAFRRALEIDPQDAEAELGLGRLLVTELQTDEAVPHLQRAVEIGTDRIEARIWLARALGTLGRDAAAVAALDEALDMAPGHTGVSAAKASILQAQGDFEGAEALFRAAIAANPKDGTIYRAFMTSASLADDDPLVAEMRALWADDSLPDEDRVHVGFALSKLEEDNARYDRVFGYLRPANDLMRKLHPYDIGMRQRRLAALREVFEPVDFEGMDLPGTTDFAPIFITGLPRSGTTLVEQIVATHPRVTGGGELGYARYELNRLLSQPGGGFHAWSDLDPADLAAVGHRVEARMRARMPGADVMTDKGMQSYTMIGPIKAVLPKARFVVVRRDPRDALLSMYRNLFLDQKHLYSYSLRDLGEYHRLFEEMLAFWHAKMPDAVHEIRYEALIEDPEAEVRKLLDACGLGWDPACLAFHENTRRVDTLSVHQVRQPLYASSMKAWQRYEGELGELFEALGQGTEAADGA